MIDTLKLSRRLEGAGMERRQAEELSEGLAEGLQGGVEQRLIRLEDSVTEVKSELKLLKWMAGFNMALTVGVLAKLLIP